MRCALVLLSKSMCLMGLSLNLCSWNAMIQLQDFL